MTRTVARLANSPDVNQPPRSRFARSMASPSKLWRHELVIKSLSVKELKKNTLKSVRMHLFSCVWKDFVSASSSHSRLEISVLMRSAQEIHWQLNCEQILWTSADFTIMFASFSFNFIEKKNASLYYGLYHWLIWHWNLVVILQGKGNIKLIFLRVNQTILFKLSGFKFMPTACLHGHSGY